MELETESQQHDVALIPGVMTIMTISYFIFTNYLVIVFLARRALINALQSQFRQITPHQIPTKYLTLDHLEVASD